MWLRISILLIRMLNATNSHAENTADFLTLNQGTQVEKGVARKVK